MNRNEIIQYFQNFQENPFPTLITRDYSIPLNGVNIFIGARKVGKTYFCYQIINSLISSGIKKTQIIRLNFENPVFMEIKATDMRKIIELYWSIYPDERNLIIFLDEIQEMPNWENAVYGLWEEFQFPMYITGSSSKLMSKEIATALRGLGREYRILSLSFPEFCRFKNIKLKIDISTHQKALIMNSFDEFLKYGGYPKVVLEENSLEKIHILTDYLQMIIYRDLIERHKLNRRQQYVIKWFVKVLAQNIANEISINKLFNDLKSRNISIGNRNLYNYLSLLEDACLIYPVYRYNPSFIQENLSIPKIYIHDLGLSALFSQKDFGKRLENIVYIELLRKVQYRPLKINYWRHPSKSIELDFIIGDNEKIQHLIQVSYDISQEDTYKREITNLFEGMKYFSLNNGWLITYDSKDEISNGKQKVFVIPFWNWILEFDL